MHLDLDRAPDTHAAAHAPHEIGEIDAPPAAEPGRSAHPGRWRRRRPNDAVRSAIALDAVTGCGPWRAGSTGLASGSAVVPTQSATLRLAVRRGIRSCMRAPIRAGVEQALDANLSRQADARGAGRVSSRLRSRELVPMFWRLFRSGWGRSAGPLTRELAPMFLHPFRRGWGRSAWPRHVHANQI